MISDPGIIPRNYRYQNALLPEKFKSKIMVKGTSHSPNKVSNDEIEITQNHTPAIKDKLNKLCKKCDCVKPPRSHHCSVCKTCVL